MPRRLSVHGSLLPLVLLVFLICTPSVEAQKKRGGQAREGSSVQVVVEGTFSTLERELIVGFFADNRVEDAKALPPGIRKRLERGKPLPPGIAKKVLPPDLEVALPERPGYQRIRVGLDVLLVEAVTGVIRDVLLDVIR